MWQNVKKKHYLLFSIFGIRVLNTIWEIHLKKSKYRPSEKAAITLSLPINQIREFALERENIFLKILFKIKSK